MNKTVKYLIAAGVGYAAYRLYSLYQLGEKVTYTPSGVKFIKGDKLLASTLRVVMKLDNPTKTTVNMRSVDGRLEIKGKVISTFSSGKFIIPPGSTSFNLDFKIDPLNIGVELLNLIANRKLPTLTLVTIKRLPLFSIEESFEIKP